MVQNMPTQTFTQLRKETNDEQSTDPFLCVLAWVCCYFKKGRKHAW